MIEDCYCGVCCEMRRDETVHTPAVAEDSISHADDYPRVIPPKRAHRLSQSFYQVLEEAARMHDRKARDYGTDEDPLANVRASEDFGIPAWLGTIVRGNDKVRRLMAYAKNGTLANEGVEDAMLDLLVYAGLALVLYRESQGQ